MYRLSLIAIAAACAVFATPTPASAQSVKDYVEGLPNNSNVGRFSTHPLKDPSTDSLPSGASKSGTEINVNGNNVSLTNWDFSGYKVNVNGEDCKIRNCILGESNGISGHWTYIDIATSAAGLIVEHNDILGYKGEGGAGSTINHRRDNPGTNNVKAAENIIIRYNKFEDIASDAIKIAGDGAYIEWNAFLDPHNIRYNPPTWNSSTTYDLNDYALNSSRILYKSKINGNTNKILPKNKALNWKNDKTYNKDDGAVNSNGVLFLSKVDGNYNNAIPNNTTSNSYWKVHNYWKVYDPHCDHITMLAAPNLLTIQYNYFSRPDKTRLTSGMNNVARFSRNTKDYDRVDDVLFHGNFIEENTHVDMKSQPVHITDGGKGNFNGPFTLSHGWYGKNKGGSYLYEHKSNFVTVYWDTNKDAETNANIPLPPYYTNRSTTPPSTSDVPQIIKDGHQGVGIVSGSYYTLKNLANDNFLDTDGDAVDANHQLVRDDTKWKLVHRGSGWYTLENKQTSQLLDTDGDAVDANHTNVRSDTKWKLVDRGSGWYTLENQANGKFLDTDGDAVDASNPNVRDDTKWFLTKR